MEERKDYYKILGVEKTASEDEIKAAYKKLALKYHPDRFASKTEKEQKEAEEKFKEINEAYQILSDKEKRNQYDNPNPFGNGENPFEGFGGFSDMFDLFGVGGMKSKKPKKGNSMQIRLTITLNELLTKTKKKVKYKRKEGNGKTCSHCGGTGQLFTNRHGMQIITECPYCGGSGIEMQEVDHECEFYINGVSPYELSYDKNSGTISFIQIVGGEGNTINDNKGQNGDLIVIVRCQIPSKFTLESETDISFKLEIPLLTALLGGEIEVKTIDNKTLNTKIPQGVSEGGRIRFASKGLMSNGRFGDMFGIIKIKMPKSLNNREREILLQLKNSENFK